MSRCIWAEESPITQHHPHHSSPLNLNPFAETAALAGASAQMLLLLVLLGAGVGVGVGGATAGGSESGGGASP